MDKQEHRRDINNDEDTAMAFFAFMFPIILSMCTIIRILKERKIYGLSINFQFLYATALVLKYLDDPMVENVPAEWIDFCIAHFWIKRLLLIFMVVTFIMTLSFAEHDKLDVWWIFGGIIVSKVFTLGPATFPARDMWMKGSYLDIVAWIKLWGFCGEEDALTSIFALSMIVDPFIEISLYIGFDYYRDKLYNNAGFKLALVKILLFVLWAIHQSRTEEKITEANNLIAVLPEPSAPPVPDLIEKCSEKPIYCIENEKNMSMNKEGVMSPN